MKIKPLFDRIVLKAINLEENKKNKLLITNLNENKPDIAEVVELGNGGFIDGEEIKFQVKIGDKVVFNKFAANEFSFNDETYILIKQIDIIAILNEI